MIPCRLFLENFHQSLENQTKVKINLTLNSLFYDQIKPFQTKYFCLLSTDVIGVEVVFQDTAKLIGKAYISNCPKRAMENQNIELDIVPAPQLKIKGMKLLFFLEPVSSFNRKQLQLSTKNLKIPISEQDRNCFMDGSFSQKEGLIESQDFTNISRGISPRQHYNETLKTVEEADSLESLAYQREKILGELFGRFKRDK